MEEYEPLMVDTMSPQHRAEYQSRGVPSSGKSRRPIPLPKPQKYDEIPERAPPPPPHSAPLCKPLPPTPAADTAPVVPKRSPRNPSRSHSEDDTNRAPLRSKPRSSSCLEGTRSDVPPPLPKAPIPSRKKAPHLRSSQKYENTEPSLNQSIPRATSPEKGTSHSQSASSSVSSMSSPLHSSDNGGAVLNLATFIAKHANDLPFRVRVEEGFCGREERDVISSGDVYNFHFIKREKVITIQDQGGNPHYIPLNSSVQFGMLYNPNSNLNEALQGFTFQSVSEITALKSTPQILCVCDSYQASQPRSSVDEKETLIVKKIGKTKMKRKPFIKVFSLKTKEEKTLYDDCTSCFTTDPYSVRLYLPDILDHFGENLPIKATLYADMDTSEDQPVHLSSDIVTLTHVSIESSIIASTCWEDEQHSPQSTLMTARPSEEDYVTIGIPTSLDIEVVVLPELSEDEKLYTHTRTLFETFDPQKVKVCGKEQTASGNVRPRFSSIRQGFEKQGFEIQKPSRIYDILLDTPPPSVLANEPREDQCPEVSPKPPLHLPKDSALLHSMFASKSVKIDGTSDTAGSDISELKASVKAIKSLVDSMQEHTQKQVNSLRIELTGIKHSVEELKRSYQFLSVDVCKLNQQSAREASNSSTASGDPVQSTIAAAPPSKQAPPPPSRRSGEADIEEENRKDLATFDHIKVLKLLEVMNMAQYQDSFIEEQVDGELLVECDEAILLHELKITSRLHRTKLMKVISGRHCAATVLLGLDPYVVLKRSE